MSTVMNYNYLSVSGFVFSIERSPNVRFNVQRAIIPGMSIGVAESPSPFVNIPTPGDKVNYEELSVSFKLDEDMQSHKELHDWIVGMGTPETFNQRSTYIADNTGYPSSVYSDATLLVMTNKGVKNVEFTFKQLFPTSISGIDLNTMTQDTVFADATATFKYLNYTYRIV